MALLALRSFNLSLGRLLLSSKRPSVQSYVISWCICQGIEAVSVALRFRVYFFHGLLPKLMMVLAYALRYDIQLIRWHMHYDMTCNDDIEAVRLLLGFAFICITICHTMHYIIEALRLLLGFAFIFSMCGPPCSRNALLTFLSHGSSGSEIFQSILRAAPKF